MKEKKKKKNPKVLHKTLINKKLKNCNLICFNV